MTEQLDPYAVLGVASDATGREISHAYRQLLQRHHPDTRQPEDSESVVDATARLQQILTAYALLRDPVSRADYRTAVQRKRLSEPVSRFPPASIIVFGDAISSEPETFLRVGPVRWDPEATLRPDRGR
ncbi:MAG: J domain-containing protein [Nocardioidaceae bacterium]